MADLSKPASGIRVSKKAAESATGKSGAKGAKDNTGQVGRAKQARGKTGIEFCFVTGAFQKNGIVKDQEMKLRVKKDGTHTYTTVSGATNTVPKFKLLRVLKVNPPKKRQ